MTTDSVLRVIFKGVDDGASSVARRVGSSFSGLSNAVKKGALIGAGAIAGLGTAAIAGGAKLINLGSDAEETASLIQTSLGDATEGFNSQLRDMASEMNRSFYELQEGSGSLIAMTKAMGASEEQAADMGLQFAGMASDLGSFFNRADADVLIDLQAALGGSSETLQKYGIIANETTLKQMALNQGLIKSKNDVLPPLIRAQLLQQAITEQASDAMGDAARTAGSWSNSLKGLKAKLRDSATEMGTKLIPIMTPLLNLIGDLAEQALPYLTDAFEFLLPYLTDASDFVSSFVGWLGTGIDPLDAFTIATRGMIPQEIIDKMVNFRDEILPTLKEKIIEIKDGILEFLDPIRQWIDDNIILKDALIGLAVILGGVVLGAIISVGVALAPIILTIGGVILAVSLLRQAWETDFLSIKTTITAWADEHGGIMEGIKAWWQDLQVTWTMLGGIISIGAAIIKAWWLKLQMSFMQLKFIVLGGVLILKNKWTDFKTTVSSLVGQIKQIWQGLADKFTSVKSGIVSSLQPIIDLIGDLKSSLAGISLPDWMTPGSPTPWELGLKGVGVAMQNLYQHDMPQMTTAIQGMNQVSNRTQTINQTQNIYTSRVDTRGESQAALQFAIGGI